MHLKDRNLIHGVEDEDHSVEDVADSMPCSNPQDKVQRMCNNLQLNQYKVNQDKWGTINAGVVRDMDIGQMIVLLTVKVMDEVVEDDMYAGE